MERSDSPRPLRLWASGQRGLIRVAGVVAMCGALAAWPAGARAQDAISAAFAPARNTLDGEAFFARPAALATGLSAGVGASYVRTVSSGANLAWGVRGSWSSATEYSLAEAVRNDDVRLRLCGLVQHVAGRGSFGLRLGLGATALYEARTRAQGSRAGLSGSALETTSWYLFPAADLDAVVLVRVWNAWGMSLSGGPTVHLIDGSARVGWSSSLGVLWQP